MIFVVMESGEMADYIDKQKTLNVIFEIAENVIRSLPSADVQPVRHERWNKIDVSGLASCGCGYITDRYSVFNYCPHCGARMDGE